MEIVFVAITKANGGVYYPGVHDAIRAAEARAGCRVWCISDREIPCSNYVPLAQCWQTSEKLTWETTEATRGKWAANSLYRWLAVRDFADAHPELSWPILALDYDVLVFSNLVEAYKALMPCDFTTFIQDAGALNAYSVHNPECLNDGVDAIFTMAKSVEVLNDMATWSAVYQSRKWRVADLTPEIGGGAFNQTIHDGMGRYVIEPASDQIWGPTSVRITWQDRHPHFTRISDGNLVRAHWIHCWGSYKFRTHELIEKAGL